MESMDFTAQAPGSEFEGQALDICQVCGRVGLPGRRRRQTTMIHKGVLIRGALNITAFCYLPARERPNE